MIQIIKETAIKERDGTTRFNSAFRVVFRVTSYE